MSQNILVNFRVVDGKTKGAKPTVQRITKHYIGGQVGTHTGDVFMPAPMPEGTRVDIKGRSVPVQFVAVA